ncbi:UvrD-helicase domain-containing protein [Desulfobacter latus]|uniref:UvrD-like helicase ATP-binding domain-containing protein n=1 Tax=Desulfobacter latus TaxID=2292 RepID=A0A850T537_9BACT|nr:UvrD-helicase domain-containing protein [Desulfobacter latus]NWH06893.1 hypothetical protein [Desulfobacter latus]
MCTIQPESILILCFNHGTMIELRRRIKALTGKRSARVTAMTFHGLAMRITGRCLLDPHSGKNGFPGIIPSMATWLPLKQERSTQYLRQLCCF